MTVKKRYKEVLEFMFRQLPMYQRQGKTAFKKDLSNILALCKAIGNPEKKFISIHVAGTNGKGSVSHMLASVLQEYGLKVGLYTSPHYKDFRERIKINGELISKLSVIEFIDEIDDHLQEIQPSFFEMTVALAFEYFAKQEVDIAIIETGLGGRLDSTNIISPLLSIITNISLDHMDMLGDTLPKIAAEKAGIIKPGIPVVIGEKSRETDSVFEKKAQNVESKLTYAEDLVKCEVKGDQLHCDLNGEIIIVDPGSISPYLKNNTCTVLAALIALDASKFTLFDKDKIRSGLEKVRENTYYIGRWEVLSQDPFIIADSAHNEAGVDLVLTKLKTLKVDQIHFVIGFVKDKSIDKILKMFPVNGRYYFVKADIPRGLGVDSLQEAAQRHQLKGRTYSSVKNGLRAAKRNANANDLIYIGGSIFVLGEVL